MNFLIESNIFLPHLIALTTLPKLSSNKIIPAAYFATSVPFIFKSINKILTIKNLHFPLQNRYLHFLMQEHHLSRHLFEIIL